MKGVQWGLLVTVAWFSWPFLPTPWSSPGKERWKGRERRQPYPVKYVHLDSFPVFNRFWNMAERRTSKLFSRPILVGEGLVNSHKKALPCFFHHWDRWACSPAPSSILDAHLQLEPILAALRAVAPQGPQPAPAGSTVLHFCFADWGFCSLCCYCSLPSRYWYDLHSHPGVSLPGLGAHLGLACWRPCWRIALLLVWSWAVSIQISSCWFSVFLSQPHPRTAVKVPVSELVHSGYSL